MSAPVVTARRSPAIRWAILSLALLLAVAALVALWPPSLSAEEETLLERLEMDLPRPVQKRIYGLTQRQRVELLRREVAEVEAVRAVGWSPTVEDLRQVGERPELVYRLAIGQSELEDCVIFDQEASPGGTCTAFSTPVPGSPSRKRRQEVRVALRLDGGGSATAENAVIGLGDSGAEATGNLRIDSTDVMVEDAQLSVPSFEDPSVSAGRVDLPGFSLQNDGELQSVERVDLRWEQDIPESMRHLFGGAERVAVLAVRGELRVDLRAAAPLYEVTGEIDLLGEPALEGGLRYSPGQQALVAIDRLSLPGPLRGICLNLEDSVGEIDFAEKRLRLLGGLALESSDGLICRRGSVAGDLDLPSRWLIDQLLGGAWDRLVGDRRLAGHGHAVVDLDDGIVCTDVSVAGTRLLQAAYFDATGRFEMWAPKRFRVELEESSFLEGALSLGRELQTAPWSFPKQEPMRCWPGDPGPRLGNLDGLADSG